MPPPNSVFFTYLIGFLAFACIYELWRHAELDPNSCAMTFMWRRMSYMDVGLNHGPYSLWLYGEGYYAQKFSQDGELNGLPIIFVPGNAGSGRQVRSLGSLLQNKTDRLETPFHFDTFALDFNEEMSALNFDYIESQAEFLRSAIDHIWYMYKAQIPPRIVLVGHSMGGIVIQQALSKSNWRDKIAFVLTFATPYGEPVYMFDKRFLRFWTSMNGAIMSNSNQMEQLKIISVSGGLKDEFLEECWTTSSIVHVHAHTAAMDRIWLDTDHQCILWCNQLVRQTSRLLFDYAADPKYFIQNFGEFAYLHYNSIGAKLKPILEDTENISRLDLSNCVPKCPTIMDPIHFNLSHHSFNRHFLLAISRFANQILEEKYKLISMEKCVEGQGNTRFLNPNNLFAFVNLSNCDQQHGEVRVAGKTSLWLLDESEVLLSDVNLSSIGILWSNRIIRNFSMEARQPLAIVPIFFTNANEFGIFRVRIWRRKCQKEYGAHRTIFLAHGVPRRFDSFDENSKSSSLLIYPTDPQHSSQSEYQLLVIDTGHCAEYSIQFSLDFRYSMIKLFRRNQRYLPSTMVFTWIFVHYYVRTNFMNSAQFFLVPFMAAFVFIYSINAFFVGLALLLSRLLMGILRLILSFSQLSGNVSAKFALFLLLLVIPFSLYTNNSFLLGGCCVFLNLPILCRRFATNVACLTSASILLLLPVVVFQAHHAFTTAWNLAKYGQLRSPSDPFFATNFTLASFTLFTLFQQIKLINFSLLLSNQHWLMRKFFDNFVIIVCIIILATVFYLNPSKDMTMCFIVLDDLSLITIISFVITQYEF